MNDVTLSSKGHLLAVSFFPEAYSMITRLFWLGLISHDDLEIGSTRYGRSLIEDNSFVRVVDKRGRVVFAFSSSIAQQVFTSHVFTGKGYYIVF